MKRMTMILILIGCLCCTQTTHASSHYQSFEMMEIPSGKLLEQFSSSDYKTYYKKVDKRRFFGWNVYKVNSNIKVSYVTETLFSYYNDGYTAIDYKYKLENKKTTKLNLSASGSIGIKNSKTEKIFKNNLDASLKLSADYQQTTDEKETFDISLKVDPGTQVDLYIYGEGKITNGVAARYVFWIRADRGGYEVFLVTTQYQRLEKKRI
ncbi:MAG: hypothetical protein IH571_03595 [Acholeplasmataceae bacterium]|nr:hypothetical protein [Acholeplasmataceae bacterium]